MKLNVLLLCSFALYGCSNYQVPNSPVLSTEYAWAIMPLENHSNTPMAAEQAEQLIATALYARGIRTIQYRSPSPDDLQSILDSSYRYEQAKQWLSEQPVDYAITGSVEEWQYKSGLDGEPVVGITLKIQPADSDDVYWQASGSRSGWGRDSVSATGQIVIETLVEGIVIENP